MSTDSEKDLFLNPENNKSYEGSGENGFVTIPDEKHKFGYHKVTGKSGHFEDKNLETDPKKIDAFIQLEKCHETIEISCTDGKDEKIID